MLRLRILIVGLSLEIISGCVSQVSPPAIISVGECERGVVTEINISYVQKLWSQAQITDVLISGGCYQEKLIKKR